MNKKDTHFPGGDAKSGGGAKAPKGKGYSTWEYTGKKNQQQPNECAQGLNDHCMPDKKNKK